MVTYGDYFSRKVLYHCGVSPNENLFKKEESTDTGTSRTENIRLKMQEIYQNLYRGYEQKNVSPTRGNFEDFQIERKIVAAFYDSGILTNSEREYFQAQTSQLLFADEREQICVNEANVTAEVTKAERVEPQAKSPLIRNIRQ